MFGAPAAVHCPSAAIAAACYNALAMHCSYRPAKVQARPCRAPLQLLACVMLGPPPCIELISSCTLQTCRSQAAGLHGAQNRLPVYAICVKNSLYTQCGPEAGFSGGGKSPHGGHGTLLRPSQAAQNGPLSWLCEPLEDVSLTEADPKLINEGKFYRVT